MESNAQVDRAQIEGRFVVGDEEVARNPAAHNVGVTKSHDAQAFLRIVGSNVLAQRQQHGWSSNDLATACSMKADELKRVEHGDVRPSGGQLVAMAEAFNIPITAFFRGVETLSRLIVSARS